MNIMVHYSKVTIVQTNGIHLQVLVWMLLLTMVKMYGLSVGHISITLNQKDTLNSELFMKMMINNIIQNVHLLNLKYMVTNSKIQQLT